jgi:hypothetical protein
MHKFESPPLLIIF